MVLWRERVFYNEWRRWDKRIRVKVRKQCHYLGNSINQHHLECVILLNDSFARERFYKNDENNPLMKFAVPE